MKNQFTLYILLVTIVSIQAQAPLPGWKADYGEEQNYSLNKASGVAYDSEGNCYVVGRIEGDPTYYYYTQLQILKYDPTGLLIDSRLIPNPGFVDWDNSIFCKILVDNSNHIYVLHTYASDYGLSNYNVSANRYDSNLDPISEVYFLGGDGFNVQAMDMAFDATKQNIFILLTRNYTTGTMLDTDGKHQSVLCSFNVNSFSGYGTYAGGPVIYFGNLTNENIVTHMTSIFVSEGDIYLTGYQFNNLYVTDKYAVIVAKVHPLYEDITDESIVSGLSSMFFKKISKSSGSNFETGNKIVADGTGNIYIAGHYYKSASVGVDGFVMKLTDNYFPYDPTFNWLNIIRGYSNYTDQALFLGLTPDNKPIVSGYQTVITGADIHKDLFIKKLNVDFGYQEWSKKFATTLFDVPFNEEPTDMLITENNIYLSVNVQHSTPVFLGYLLGYNFSGSQIIADPIIGSSPYEGGQARALAYHPGFLELAVAGNNIDYDVLPYGANWFLKKYGIALKTTDDISNINTLSIYPNPTSDFVNITSQQKNYTIEIFNLNGEKIRTAFSENESTTINLKDLSKGVYIILVFNENFKEQKSVVLQ